MNDKAYEEGQRSVARDLLRRALDWLGYKGVESERTLWILERERAVASLREFCKHFGDNDWEPDTDLSDVIRKHLRNYLEDVWEKVDKPLQKIREDVEGQDNRATAHPIYVVQQKKRVYGFSVHCVDDMAWLNEEGDEVADEHDEDWLDRKVAYEHDHGCVDWDRTGYQDFWEFVQPFFSEKAASAYLRNNAHNLNEPRVYVESGYRNYEWQAVRAVLKGNDRDD